MFLVQDGTTVHTANYSINIKSVLKLICRRLWSEMSPVLNPCDFYLLITLKYKVYSYNTHTLDKFKQRIRKTITYVEVN
jgi:hypothetical protein